MMKITKGYYYISEGMLRSQSPKYDLCV